MRTRAIALAGALAFGVPGAGPAGADDLRATYGGELEERGHRVRAVLEGRTARLVITRRFANLGARVEEASLSMELPPSAAATGLRIRDRGRWRRGELLEAGAARERYRELTRSGPAGRRGPALLSWGGRGRAELEVFPIAPGGHRDVEVTLRAAPCYAAGLYAVAYPAGGPPAPRIRAAGRGGRVLQPGASWPAPYRELPGACQSAGYAADADAWWIVWPVPARRPLAAAFARWKIGEDRHLLRVEVEAPRVLEPAPRRARVVFVVDASRSQEVSGIRAQLELVRGYLAHVPDAHFEVVLYRREAERLLGRFARASAAEEILGELPPGALEPGNGSHLDRGLALAASLVTGAPGPARIVAFTDHRLRAALSPERLARAPAPAAERAVLHLVHTELDRGQPYRYTRKDDDELAAIPAASGGMLVEMRGASGGPPAAEEAMLGLVRPIQIDELRVEAPGREIPLAARGAFAEGDSVRSMEVAGAAPGEVVLRGRIWGRQLERRLSPDAELSARLPALAFGSDVWRELEAEEVVRVARAGGAVSPVTSYLADPGAEPSSYPHEVTELSGSGRMVGTGGVSCGCGGLAHRGAVVRSAERFDPDAVLRRMLEPRVDACAGVHGGRSAALRVSLETTGVEVVDVSVRGAGDELSACVAEAAWELHLGPSFGAGRGRYDLRF